MCVLANLKIFPLFIVFSVTEGKITCLLGKTGNTAENPFPPQAVAWQGKPQELVCVFYGKNHHVFRLAETFRFT